MTRFLSDSKVVRFVQAFVFSCVGFAVVGWLLYRDPPTAHIAAMIGTGIALGLASLTLPGRQRSQ